MFNSLSKKIAIAMILTTLLCTVSLTVISFIMVEKSMIVQMKNDGTTLINVLSRQIEEYRSDQLEGIKGVFRSISDKNMQNVEYISITDRNLNIIVDDVRVTGIKDSVDGVTSATEQGNIVNTIDSGEVSGFIYNNDDNHKVYNISAPIALLDGFTSVINIGISLNPMYSQLYSTVKNILIVSVLVQIITVIVALIVSKSLTKPLIKIVNSLKKVENNDLTDNLEVKSNDEIEKVANALNITINNLRGTISTIKDTTHTLTDSSDVLAKSATDSSSFSEEIAASVEEVNAVIENQNVNILNISDNFEGFSKKLDNILKEISNILIGNNKINKTTEEGNNQLQLLITSINEVRELFINSRNKISDLNNNIDKINHITDVINNVAEQTNLLSLNASIEAARAGSAGTGFGVVAEEIRSLSEQVRESSNSINNIVTVITTNSKEILDESLIISTKMQEQICTINETVNACEDIKDEVNRNTKYINGVSESLSSIKIDKENITESVIDITNISSEVTASTQEVAATLMSQTENAQNISELGETLRNISEELNNMINEFNI